jgi:formylglycine-generating enzyme
MRNYILHVLIISFVLLLSQITQAVSDVEQDRTHSFTDSATEMGFVFVKGGCFDMGDNFGDGNDDEKPVHEVCVEDFYIGKYEVTQGQWKDIMGNNPSEFKTDRNYPVENVSWDEVQDFISSLNRKTGQNYRLPTEAEYEYAARSGGKKEKWSGTSIETELNRYAWYDYNSGNTTHPVGQKEPNGLGLYDMSGNVWEWCSDWYGNEYYNNSPKNNPKGPSSGSFRVGRGGSWDSGPRNRGPGGVRASNRGNGKPVLRLCSLGFRLVRTP